MSTPDEPQNPYGEQPQEPADPFRKPDPAQPPAAPQYGAPPPPPYGAPQPPQYGTPPPPAPYGAPQPPQYGAQAYPPAPYPGAPQYGAPGTPGYGPNPTEKNSLAVWALVLGILSIPCCGLFSGIPAVIVGRRGQAYAAEGRANNRGMATAGVVLGWIGIALSVVRIILAVTGQVDLVPDTN